jgi:hypothetical protein
MLNLVLLLLLAAATVASTSGPCTESCHVMCTDPTCVKDCSDKCHSALTHTEKPWFQLEHIQSFPAGTQITGSDTPSKPRSRVVYFTTLDGKVYRYNAASNHMKMMHKLPAHTLDMRHGKGLYDIAFHRDFDKNGKVYLHYATYPPNDSKERYRDHDNVIVELETSGLGMDFVREIKRIPQYTPERSGGWTKMGLREGFSTRKVWLYTAVGGNKEEIVSRNEGAPALSTIYAIAQPEDRTQVEERVWASGIQDPIDCSASVFKADRIQCLIEDSQGKRHVQSLRKGYNYGSDEFVESCFGKVCRNQFSMLASRDALVSFEATECTVRSLQMYTGHNMRNYQMDMFMTRDACYDSRLKQFNSTEVLRIYRDHSAGQYKTIVMPTNMIDDMMVNTTLVGGDKLDDFYVAGYSMRSGEYSLHRIVPIKAAE